METRAEHTRTYPAHSRPVKPRSPELCAPRMGFAYRKWETRLSSSGGGGGGRLGLVKLARTWGSSGHSEVTDPVLLQHVALTGMLRAAWGNLGRPPTRLRAVMVRATRMLFSDNKSHVCEQTV